MAYRKKNGLAVASLILGVLSWIIGGIFTAIPGAITGHMARSRARNFPDQYAGSGMAMVGLVLSYLAIVLSIIAIVLGIYWYSTGELDSIINDAMNQMGTSI